MGVYNELHGEPISVVIKCLALERKARDTQCKITPGREEEDKPLNRIIRRFTLDALA